LLFQNISYESPRYDVLNMVENMGFLITPFNGPTTLHGTRLNYILLNKKLLSSFSEFNNYVYDTIGTNISDNNMILYDIKFLQDEPKTNSTGLELGSNIITNW